MRKARLLAAAVSTLAVLATCFFAAFGWFSLVHQWDTALNVLCWAAICGGAAAALDAAARATL